MLVVTSQCEKLNFSLIGWRTVMQRPKNYCDKMPTPFPLRGQFHFYRAKNHSCTYPAAPENLVSSARPDVSHKRDLLIKKKSPGYTQQY